MAISKDVREGIGKSGHSLNRRESELSDVVLRQKAEDALDLRIVHMLLNANDVRVHVADIIDIAEDECLLRVETKGENILDIVASHLVGALGSIKFNLLLVNVLLVISDLNNEGYVENTLEPLGEDERHTVTHMEGIGRRTSTGVKIEGLTVLICVKNLLKVALAEENTAANEPVGTFSNGAL